ncbi:MAG: histidine--tRNA ligase [Alphaproteobacteria bacterium]|nr:histidine--tRNA ligase [Alphaproteobacteria bacterium]
MSSDKKSRPKARLPRGFRDRPAADIAAERQMLETIRRVYESYGFEPLETPAFEYTDALGKFLPDLDRPNEGVFSLKDDDGQWLSLRYDLTAPLARYVAENFQHLPKPFRRYQVGTVWRNEKPGPGRYREFTQFDADTVGSASSAADAELLMMTCDALEALGLKRGEYIVKINSRELLDGVLTAAGVDSSKRGTVLRAIDKLDRLGADGMRALLGKGRKDESGDFTSGAELSDEQITSVIRFAEIGKARDDFRKRIGQLTGFGSIATNAANNLDEIVGICVRNEYETDRVMIDTSVIRGLEYYTGPVFEAQLTFPIKNERGNEIVFGSVAGGGRYDDLVARFTGQQVPATGISIGVSRLLTALTARGLSPETKPLIVVLTTDDASRSFAMARELREAGLRAEAYVGTKKFGDQMKYADKRGAAIAVIEGADERGDGRVTLKDLNRGAELAKEIESRAEWLSEREAQITVRRDQLASAVKTLLNR